MVGLHLNVINLLIKGEKHDKLYLDYRDWKQIGRAHV